MSMSRVAMTMNMIVRMAGMAVAMIVAKIVALVMALVMAMVVRKPGHAPILPVRKQGRPSTALIRHFDTVFAGMD